jgi:hypothetical protein
MSYRTGDVVLANLINGIENRRSVGKTRPVILIDEVNGHWNALGLTTKSHYLDGTTRVAIPTPVEIGLNGPGFFWGTRLTRISKIDVLQHLGQINAETTRAITRHTHLSLKQVALLGKSVGVR